jgi:hypothetical protein
VRPGDHVEVRGIIREPRAGGRISRGTRGTVRSLDNNWATIELPTGGRFEAHTDNLTRLVRAENGDA